MKSLILIVNCLLLLLTTSGRADDQFDELMGAKSGSFRYVQTPEDFRRLDRYREIYNEQKSLGAKQTIPKVLHFIWLGSSDFPARSLRHLDLWKKLHPGWTLKFWTDIDREPPIEGMEKKLVSTFAFKRLEKEYYQTENFGERARILTYEILHREGGLYADHDVLPCVSFDQLNGQYHFYCSLEPLGPTILSTSVFPGNHLLAAAPGHPILLEAMDWLKTHFYTLEGQFPGSSPLAVKNRVMHRTLWALSEGIEKGIGRGDIVFPSAYFSEPNRSSVAMAIHHHDEEWTRSATPFEIRVFDQLSALVKEENQGIWTLMLFVCCSFALTGFLLYKSRKGALLFLLLLTCRLSANEFEELMGRATEHWAQVTQENEVCFLERCSRHFEQNKSLALKKEGDYKIPQKVHFIWLGPNPFPPGSVENVRSWIAHHPGWEVLFWTDRERLPPCEGMKVKQVEDFPFLFLKEHFEESQNWGEKSDVLRYEILYQMGGTYVDHDANCLIPFDGLHRGYDLYCGLEAPHPPFAGRNITAGIGVLGARPGHPRVKQVIDLIAHHWTDLGEKYPGRDGYSRTQLVMERTYMTLTETLVENLETEGMVDIVFPSAYFFPKKGITPLYSNHFYANSWAGEDHRNPHFEKTARRTLGKAERRGRMIRRVAQGALLLNLLIILGMVVNQKRRSRAAL
jgi:mannosyltransferase OCH1-like enzyme